MELELKAVKKEKNASKTAQLEKRIDKAKEDMEMKVRSKYSPTKPAPRDMEMKVRSKYIVCA